MKRYRKIFTIIIVLLILGVFYVLGAPKENQTVPTEEVQTVSEEPKQPEKEIPAEKPVEQPKPVEKPVQKPVTPQPTPQPAPQPKTLGENSVEALVNNERVKNGLGRYKSNETLRSSACAKGRHMLNKQYWSHDAPDGTKWWSFIAASGYRYSLAGENLAHGYATDQQAVTGWMNSPTHRANILGSFKEQGICSISGTLLGSPGILIVQHLGTQ